MSESPNLSTPVTAPEQHIHIHTDQAGKEKQPHASPLPIVLSVLALIAALTGAIVTIYNVLEYKSELDALTEAKKKEISTFAEETRENLERTDQFILDRKIFFQDGGPTSHSPGQIFRFFVETNSDAVPIVSVGAIRGGLNTSADPTCIAWGEKGPGGRRLGIGGYVYFDSELKREHFDDPHAAVVINFIQPQAKRDGPYVAERN